MVLAPILRAIADAEGKQLVERITAFEETIAPLIRQLPPTSVARANMVATVSLVLDFPFKAVVMTINVRPA